MKILVIEDQEELLNSIFNYIEDQFQCEYALDCKDARFRLSRETFDCFIIDIGLPDGSGLDLVKEIKKQQPESFIIIISARNSKQNMRPPLGPKDISSITSSKEIKSRMSRSGS